MRDGLAWPTGCIPVWGAELPHSSRSPQPWRTAQASACDPRGAQAARSRVTHSLCTYCVQAPHQPLEREASTRPPPENAAGACLTPRACPPSGCTLLLGSALDALCHTASMYCPARLIPQPRVDPQTAHLCLGKALCQECPFHPRKCNHLSGSTQTAHPQEAL